MSATKICLKISFQGEVGFIICETNSSYEQIIAQISARFDIPESQRAGLVLTNGQGYVFEQQLLEYFLLLFPCPELTFYLRIDWQKLRRALIAAPSSVQRRRVSVDTTEISTNTAASSSAPDDVDYVAVPVHRQNCFLGALPTSGSTVRRQNCLQQQQPQQHQPQQQRPPSRALRQLASISSAVRSSHSQTKRMRLLPQCHKPGRGVSTASAPHLALLVANTTAPSRSIRI